MKFSSWGEKIEYSTLEFDFSARGGNSIIHPSCCFEVYGLVTLFFRSNGGRFGGF